VYYNLLLSLLALQLICAFIGYNTKKNRLRAYELLQVAQNENSKSNEVFNYLLPDFVRDKVKDGIRYMQKDQGTVSILFCDICDFDDICAKYSPEELTAFLHDLY
jgi:hypothetical protein